MGSYRRIICTLVMVLLVFNSVFISAAAASSGTIYLDAAKMNGEVYIKASSLTNQLGGNGMYDPKNQKFIYDAKDRIPLAVEQVSPSVVAIIGKPETSGGADSNDRFNLAHGTGVIVKSDGWIITNAHVVKDMSNVMVVTSDGKQLIGQKKYIDEESDLAVVKIGALGLRTSRFAAKEVQAGEAVIAIGTPVSFALRNSVTTGVISGIDRSIHSTYRLLQTDAAINPGNSGGPLVNLKGEIVGINSLKYSAIGVDNLGFSIPADTVQYVLNHYIKYGKVKRVTIGLELEESWSAVVGLPTDDPLTVSQVEAGSPAAAAAIKAGDELIAINGHKVSTLVEYNEQLKKYLPGQKVQLTVKSNGSVTKRTATLQESKSGSLNSGSVNDNPYENQQEVWMKIGNAVAAVNGKNVTSKKPFILNGTAFVPADVLAQAFKASWTWDAKANTGVIRFGSRTIKLSAGNKQASVDGKAVTLPQAPRLQEGALMVPIRFVADMLGIKLSYYPATSELIISGSIEVGGGSNLNGDAGKTKVGNSYYNWSIKYPSGWVKDYQSDAGDAVSFGDAKGEYVVDISVRESTALTEEGLLKTLSDLIEGTILDKAYVKDGTLSYAKVISKDEEGVYSESRAYLANGRIYYVVLTVFAEQNFKNASKSKVYKELLDSFKTSFDPNDKTLKDISNVKDGYRTIEKSDYGLSFSLPANWTSASSGKELYYVNKDDRSEYLRIKITSVKEGDTVAAWAARQEQEFKETFREQYREVGEMKDTLLAGRPAKQQQLSFQYEEDWTVTENFYVFFDRYKCKIEFGYDKNASATQIQQMISKVTESVVLDTKKLNDTLGLLEDDEDFIDKSKMTEYRNTKYGYTIQIPSFWTEEYGDDSDSVSYSFPGGFMVIEAQSGDHKSEVVQDIEDYKTDQRHISKDFKIIEEKDEVLFGESAKKYVFEDKEKGVAFQDTIYVLTKGGNTYAFYLGIDKAASTDENVKRLHDALMSFKLN